MKSKDELILHPARMRILVALAGRELTAQQLAGTLSDIPQATLYRQLNILVKNKLIAITQEWERGSSQERKYALSAESKQLTASNFVQATAADHANYFTMFISSVMADFARYRVKHEHDDKLDVAADGVMYATIPVNLSDEEFQQLRMSIQTLLLSATSNPLTPERRRRLLTTIVIPDDPEA